MTRPDFIRSMLSVAEVDDLRATIAELREATKGAAVIANHAGGRIRELEAEITRLKAIDDERHERACADIGRRVSVENELLLLATGKRGPIEPEEARRLALKLGVPEWFNERVTERGAAAASAAPVERIRHKVRGSTYRVIGEAEGQISSGEIAMTLDDGSISPDGACRVVCEGDSLTFYQAEHDGKLWWRFPDEMVDGRFEPVEGETSSQQGENL